VQLELEKFKVEGDVKRELERETAK